ncbi:MAG TPA: Uma2 family endonuclease [Candidatus Wunengus sp. YC60]|uniref:Uma2 family endonuclease n=1 Tax=Candidatus Wunengus sp. YC60 TaxID=3367697 RepID=UPI0040285BDA
MFSPIFVSNENKKVITKDNIKGLPDLLVEILSPSTSRRDIGIKKKLYARHGVREYWIADPERKTVEVFGLKGREFENKRYGMQDCLSSNVIKSLMIEVKEIFI